MSDDKIKSDLLQSLADGVKVTEGDYEYYSQISPDHEYIFSDFEIEKRQTTPENKTDTVYVNASLSSTDDIIQYIGHFVLYYSLYNNGWMLDDIRVDSFAYVPLQSTEFTIEELTEVLNCWDYKNATNINVTNYEADLDEGYICYYLTATCQYKYVVEDFDIEIVFKFTEAGWNASNAYVSNITSTNNIWYIADEFDNPDDRDNLIINVDGLIDTLSITYHEFNLYSPDDYSSISNIYIYKVSETSLKNIMSDFFGAINRNDAEYITYYDFSIKMQGDCTDFYSFEYVAWWDGPGNRCDGMLFIGRDNLGYLWGDDYEIDQYNRRIVVDTSELISLS